MKGQRDGERHRHKVFLIYKSSHFSNPPKKAHSDEDSGNATPLWQYIMSKAKRYLSKTQPLTQIKNIHTMTGKRPRPESPTDGPITRSKILKSLDDQTDDSISSTSSDTANNSPTSSLNSSSTLEDESATDIVDKDASSGKDPLPEGRAYAPDEVFTEVNG